MRQEADGEGRLEVGHQTSLDSEDPEVRFALDTKCLLDTGSGLEILDILV